jgi:hypothetical protein
LARCVISFISQELFAGIQFLEDETLLPVKVPQVERYRAAKERPVEGERVILASFSTGVHGSWQGGTEGPIEHSAAPLLRQPLPIHADDHRPKAHSDELVE